jgi:hypothetical protein
MCFTANFRFSIDYGSIHRQLLKKTVLKNNIIPYNYCVSGHYPSSSGDMN